MWVVVGCHGKSRIARVWVDGEGGSGRGVRGLGEMVGVADTSLYVITGNIRVVVT